ncbi:hypothetical protein DAI22_01g431300 [Oryza sativa Japonica Group]|nr:hypothetical protein DAI22_01g431300 [Oryza sativa Japonica Group]
MNAFLCTYHCEANASLSVKKKPELALTRLEEDDTTYRQICAGAAAVRAMEEGRGGDPPSSSSSAAAAAGVAIGYPFLEPQQGARLRRRRTISPFKKYFSRGFAIGMEIAFIVFGTIVHFPVWARIFLIISLSILPFSAFSITFQEY